MAKVTIYMILSECRWPVEEVEACVGKFYFFMSLHPHLHLHLHFWVSNSKGWVLLKDIYKRKWSAITLK